MGIGGKKMSTNLELIQEVVEYIDHHLDQKLSLDIICDTMGYSKFHLHRIFTSVVGFSIHTYIQRRRLTEAARLLVFSNNSIMKIALFAGYETQQSFTSGFKKMFHCTPNAFRKKREFLPLQLKYTVDGKKKLRGDKMMKVRFEEKDNLLFVGYMANTKWGFRVIPKCWKNLLKNVNRVTNRVDQEFMYAINDYSNNPSFENKQPGFDYYAVVEVSDKDNIPEGMVLKELPATKYVIFHFYGDKKDSIQPVVEYIYNEWFPQSTCQYNEKAMYDFVKDTEVADENGKSEIEVWVPIR